MHWSGGKDSAYALWKVLQEQELCVEGLVTNLSSEFRRISMHGVKEVLLDCQAAAMVLPVEKLMLPQDCSMKDYDRLVIETLQGLKQRDGEVHIFGDIFLEDLKMYRDQLVEKAGVKACYPIWQECQTPELARRIIDAGIKAVVVCVSGKFFNPSWLGREYDEAFLADLPSGVDPCGENGEFHTFVYDCPMFTKPIDFKLEQTVNRNYAPNKEDEDCDCCKTWDTEFFFQEISLAGSRGSG